MMEPITLSNGDLVARIDHARGGSIMDLHWQRRRGPAVPIIARGVPGEDPSSKPGCFVMAPWTNRVAGARFEFQGADHALRPTTPEGAASHGDVRARPWRVIDRSPESARLGFLSSEHAGVNFPFPFACQARYEVEGLSLRVDLSLTNTGPVAMPAGLGLHPYFPRWVPGQSRQVRLMAPVRGRYPAWRSIPRGPAARDALSRRLSELRSPPGLGVDDVFDGFGGWAVLAYGTHTVRMDAPAPLGHLVVYTPVRAGGQPEPFIAVEPVSMVNDGFNMLRRGTPGTGVRVLPPGGGMSATVVFSVTPADGTRSAG
ncbi:MAG: hypothetical protein C0475_08630 [Planctomyces sp.]|nr:hypothetical protein [Planctomyces sp.]MBA4039125.1 hypothetical protein [Planctomyces sp.]MBA4119912.1 hypothetical protein [Isosphaera sp.]